MMKMLVVQTTIASLFTLSLLASHVDAQTVDPETHKLRIEGFGRLAFAGEVDVEVGSTTFESDLEVGLGFGAGFEYVLHRHFSAGARIQALFTEVEADSSNHAAFDFNIMPRARFPLPDGPVAIFVALPLGLSVIDSELGDGADDTETGFNIAILFGTDFFVSESIGFLVEMGYQWHFFSRQAIGRELDVTAGNLLLQAGLKFAF